MGIGQSRDRRREFLRHPYHRSASIRPHSSHSSVQMGLRRAKDTEYSKSNKGRTMKCKKRISETFGLLGTGRLVLSKNAVQLCDRKIRAVTKMSTLYLNTDGDGNTANFKCQEIGHVPGRRVPGWRHRVIPERHESLASVKARILDSLHGTTHHPAVAKEKKEALQACMKRQSPYTNF